MHSQQLEVESKAANVFGANPTNKKDKDIEYFHYSGIEEGKERYENDPALDVVKEPSNSLHKAKKRAYSAYGTIG